MVLGEQSAGNIGIFSTTPLMVNTINGVCQCFAAIRLQVALRMLMIRSLDDVVYQSKSTNCKVRLRAESVDDNQLRFPHWALILCDMYDRKLRKMIDGISRVQSIRSKEILRASNMNNPRVSSLSINLKIRSMEKKYNIEKIKRVDKARYVHPDPHAVK